MYGFNSLVESYLKRFRGIFISKRYVGRNMIDANQIVKFSKWLLEGPLDPADDREGGEVIERANAGNEIWYIPGSWGREDSPPRTVEVPSGKSLIIVGASSHATTKELKSGESLNLTQYAQWVDGLWSSVSLEFEGGNGPRLETTPPSGEFDVNIQNDNYVTLANISKGPTKMVTVLRACEYKPERGTHKFTIKGKSRLDNSHGKSGEKEYNLKVMYTLSVV